MREALLLLSFRTLLPFSYSLLRLTLSLSELMDGGNLYDVLHLRKVPLSEAQKRSISLGISRGTPPLSLSLSLALSFSIRSLSASLSPLHGA